MQNPHPPTTHPAHPPARPPTRQPAHQHARTHARMHAKRLDAALRERGVEGGGVEDAALRRARQAPSG